MTGVWSSIICFAGGAFLWTFLEYLLHRFLGHWKHGKNDFTREHLRHHRETHYFAPARKKAAAAAVAVGTLALILGLLLGWLQGACMALSVGIMYLAYEVIHKRAHTHSPAGAYGRWLRKHHFYHHFNDPKMNHGVTTPLWDMVFGTNVTPDVVVVPGRSALRWLVDQQGEILPQFSSDYKFRESKPCPA